MAFSILFCKHSEKQINQNTPYFVETERYDAFFYIKKGKEFSDYLAGLFFFQTN